MTKPAVFNYSEYERLKTRLDSIEQALMDCDRYTVNIDGADTVVLREADVMWEVRHAMGERREP